MSSTLPNTKEIDALGLQEACKVALPIFDGLGIETGQIVVRRTSGEFTQAELAQLNGLLNAHNAQAIRAAREAARQALRDLQAVDPNTLQTVPRFQRIERLLDALITRTGGF